MRRAISLGLSFFVLAGSQLAHADAPRLFLGGANGAPVYYDRAPVVMDLDDDGWRGHRRDWRRHRREGTGPLPYVVAPARPDSYDHPQPYPAPRYDDRQQRDLMIDRQRLDVQEQQRRALLQQQDQQRVFQQQQDAMRQRELMLRQQSQVPAPVQRNVGAPPVALGQPQKPRVVVTVPGVQTQQRITCGAPGLPACPR